ncbi:helix-turn-helix domain-containing protein [Schinkia sp. CFF1]
MNKNTWLVNLRTTAELTQEKVADLVEIDRSYYTKIENGLTPSVRVAQRIANVLGFNWTIFFEKDCVKNAHKIETA